MIRVPDYRQEYDYDCGASALRIVAGYFQVGFGTAAETIEAVGTDEYGTQLHRIADCLRSFGLAVAVVGGMTLDQLRRQKTPVICAMQKDGGGHYVVVTGVDADDVYLQDPGCGAVKMPALEFERNWYDFGADDVTYLQFGIVVGAPEE